MSKKKKALRLILRAEELVAENGTEYTRNDDVVRGCCSAFSNARMELFGEDEDDFAFRVKEEFSYIFKPLGATFGGYWWAEEFAEGYKLDQVDKAQTARKLALLFFAEMVKDGTVKI
jgi:hypothetical protein